MKNFVIVYHNYRYSADVGGNRALNVREGVMKKKIVDLSSKDSKEMFDWPAFAKYAEELGIDLDYEGDWYPWWHIWCRAYIEGYRNRETSARRN